MTIFIHGFGSSGFSGKADLLRGYFRSIGEPYIAPSLSHIPKLAIATLDELVDSYDDVTLIGSSLGGFYALYLAERYNLRAVLINPSINPAKTLRRVIGSAVNYYDNTPMVWSESYLHMLEEYEVDETKSDYMLLIQKGDDLLDYREAISKVPHAMILVEEGGTHQFEGIDHYFETIREFLL